MVLAAVSSVAMVAGTLSLVGIAQAWEPWWLLWQLPGLVVFFVAGLAELQRPPFDMPLADAEIDHRALHRVRRACGSRCSCWRSTPASSCSRR